MAWMLGTRGLPQYQRYRERVALATFLLDEGIDVLPNRAELTDAPIQSQKLGT